MVRQRFLRREVKSTENLTAHSICKGPAFQVSQINQGPHLQCQLLTKGTTRAWSCHPRWS